MNNLINNFQKNEAEVKSFLMKQESAPTITLFGPSNSTKSTSITELLEPASNKLLGYNIGEIAQTTLIRLKLMLNSHLNDNDVILKCIPYKDADTTFIKFLIEVKKVLIEKLYNSRDDLEDFQEGEELVNNILNPKDRGYHCLEYVRENDFMEEFSKIISDIVRKVINDPELLSDEVDSKYKERRKSQKEIKKIEIYEEVIERRFCDDPRHTESIRTWFDRLTKKLLNEFSDKWNHEVKNENGEIEGYIICDKISIDDSGVIGQVFKRIYEADSAYSLVFNEVNYVTAPSSKFSKAYAGFLTEENTKNQGRRLKINIVDTVGITQVSREREQISNEMDKIFQIKTDAYLFLCATDELPSIYDECISLLKLKLKKFQNKVFVLCRTKADEIIRRKMAKKWLSDTGINEIAPEHYEEYLLQAYEEFKEDLIYADENIRSAEYSICNHLPIEFLCTAPDRSKEMQAVINDGELESSKLYKILYKIMREIDKKYSNQNDRQWLYSKDLSHRPLNIECKAHELNKTICTALLTCNMQQKNQYLQYDKPSVIYHWNSVYSFLNKLSWGEGHETRAAVYGSFRLFQKNMIASWLRKMIPMEDMLNDISISYEYLDSEPEQAEYVKENFPIQFRSLIAGDWNGILDRVAKKLSYDRLQPELNKFFTQYYYDSAFKESLRYFDRKFSEDDYWKNNLLELLLIEFDSILQKMYIFDEM